ncbi:MAG: SUMF1/EgtB/PvdO family nonheme iron enzyme [Nitrospirae bacterium]|nr:SUMF1/EgtB/PvdO family nonheme iron enzyme [Nitrospirota bacterium]MBI3353103.1 SUMF1/EgtB/PvdO family nonheme iron enzyme [Nitrospirota bacterium]
MNGPPKGRRNIGFSFRLQFFLLLLFVFFPLAKSGSSENERPEIPKMVLIKGGCFEMGNSFDEEMKDEKPVHRVCLDDFYLGETEVTQGEWKKVMGSDAAAYFRSPDRPVEEAMWDDAQAFLKRLNEQTGQKYRLPTEAEWEYAAREEGRKERWAGTNNDKDLGKYAWYSDNSNHETHPVKQKLPNQLGLYDMSGNVWEWVQDWYDQEYYAISPRDNPKGPDKGKYLVLRGGAWNSRADFVRADFRFKDTHDKSFNYFCGFRLALSPASNEPKK